MASSMCFGGPIRQKAKIVLQQDQQPSDEQQSTAPPPEPEENFNDDEEGSDTVYSDEDDAAYEEEADGNPFPEIVTAPVRIERNISKDQWLKLIRDDAFKYEEPEVKKDKAETGPNWWSKMITGIFEFLASGLGNFLILGVVVLIVLVIIIRIVQLNGNVFFSKKDKKLTETTDELSDEYVPDDWEKVIQEAAAAGNYRLAVRHGYRYLLNLLQQKELINYQVAKTNYQYAFELSGTQLHRPFMQLTRDYEYAWYGGFNIQQERFEAYYRKVSDIKKELDQKG
jgi:hypothetical protein